MWNAFHAENSSSVSLVTYTTLLLWLGTCVYLCSASLAHLVSLRKDLRVLYIYNNIQWSCGCRTISSFTNVTERTFQENSSKLNLVSRLGIQREKAFMRSANRVIRVDRYCGSCWNFTPTIKTFLEIRFEVWLLFIALAYTLREQCFLCLLLVEFFVQWRAKVVVVK